MSSTSAPIDATPARGLEGRSRTIALIVAATMFMQLLDATIIATSLPQIAESFAVTPAALSIGVTIYMLTMAVFMPVSGWLADRFGARTVFVAAIVIFVLASLAVGASQNLEAFVLARAAQGVGGALMTPVGRMLVLKSTEKRQLLHAIALITWPALFAPVIGPVIGGFITTYFSWHWNFYINLPLGAVGIALVWRFIPDYRSDARRALDMKGLVLTASASGALLYGLETLAHGGLDWRISLSLIVAGGLLGALAVRHLQVSERPLIDLSAFAHQTFRHSNISTGLMFRCAIAATPFLLPLYFQLALGMSALEAGFYLLVYFLGNLAMKTLTTPIVRLAGFRTVIIVNGLLCFAFLAAFALIDAATPEPLIWIALFGAGLTRSMQFTALNTLGFADVDADQSAGASTLSSIVQQMAMIAGVALAAAILGMGLSWVPWGGGGDTINFQIAFGLIAALCLLGSLLSFRLPADAGAAVANRER